MPTYTAKFENGDTITLRRSHRYTHAWRAVFAKPARMISGFAASRDRALLAIDGILPQRIGASGLPACRMTGVDVEIASVVEVAP